MDIQSTTNDASVWPAQNANSKETTPGHDSKAFRDILEQSGVNNTSTEPGSAAATNTAKSGTGSNLSNEMLDQLAGTVAPTETERTVYDMTKERLDEAFNDPNKARRYVDSFKHIMLIPGNGLQMQPNGSSADVWEKFRVRSNLQMSRMTHLAEERSTSIDKMRSDGKSDVEIIVEMLDFEANAPARYGADAVGYDQPEEVFKNKSYAEFSAVMRDYLSELIEEETSGHA